MPIITPHSITPHSTDSVAENCCYFADSYDRINESVIQKIERLTLGSDYGGTSWATLEQVDDIVNHLDLNENSHLLDIGSGCGWPSLYLSEKSGCSATLVDLPLVAIKQASQRAQRDNIHSRIHCIQGNGASLPIADCSYDRLNHSDVLCCLPEKHEFLGECRRVATDTAVMYFSVLLPAGNLPSDDYARVLEFGPPHIDTPDGYDDMITAAGWKIRAFLDVTAEFDASQQTLVESQAKYKKELIELYGETDYHDQVTRRITEQQLTSQNQLKRVIYVVDAVA